MGKYVLALDQGTTSSRAIVFNERCEVVGKAQKEFAQHYPAPGWVEHLPSDIFNSQLAVLLDAIQNAKLTANCISAIGITNQRETTLAWDKRTGKPICNAIVWQCRRTAEACKIIEENYGELIYQRTGLRVDAYFSASKMQWILQNVPAAKKLAENGNLAFGTVDTFLMYKLSGGKIFATDYTNASRTMLFDIHNLRWDDDLLKIFGIPRSCLPEVYASSCLFGYTDENIVGAKIPIFGVAGDQQAALFGQGCTKVGMAKNTYGTGCFLLMNTGNNAVRSSHGLLTTVAASVGEVQYALEGSVFVGGAVIQWLRDELCLIENAAQTEQMALSVPDSGGVYVVPAFVGMGAPYWDSDARGIICGITRGTTKNHVVRAALESIAYQVSDVISAMEGDCGTAINQLKVDGGASANNFLMQFQSDISQKTVVRPQNMESTALGACLLAGIAVGIWQGQNQVEQLLANATQFVPQMDKLHSQSLLSGWKKAIARTIL